MFCVDHISPVLGGHGQRRAIRACRVRPASRCYPPPGHRSALVHRRPIASVTSGPSGHTHRRPSGGRSPRSCSPRSRPSRCRPSSGTRPLRCPLLTY